MIVSIIEKYGLVPQSIYPESKLLLHYRTQQHAQYASKTRCNCPAWASGPASPKDKISNARNEML